MLGRREGEGEARAVSPLRGGTVLSVVESGTGKKERHLFLFQECKKWGR